METVSGEKEEYLFRRKAATLRSIVKPMLTLGWKWLVILRTVLYRPSLYFIGLDGPFWFTEYFAVMRCFLAVLVLVLVLELDEVSWE